MQFSKAEEYGMMGVLFLAKKNHDVVTPLSEISAARNIPEKFLAKIFQSLSRSGIVRSHRGVRGGFTLRRNPAETTVKQVLEAIQGPYHLMKNTEDLSGRTKGDFNAIRELLMIAEGKLLEVFETHSLADLLRWQEAGVVLPH